MGAVTMLESENYIISGLFLFLAFWVPLQDDIDKWFKRKFGIETGAEVDSKTEGEVGSEEATADDSRDQVGQQAAG